MNARLGMHNADLLNPDLYLPGSYMPGHVEAYALFSGNVRSKAEAILSNSRPLLFLVYNTNVSKNVQMRRCVVPMWYFRFLTGLIRQSWVLAHQVRVHLVRLCRRGVVG